MSKITTHRHTSYTLTEGDNEFECTCEPSDCNQVAISTSGKRAVVGYLCQDNYDPLNPRKEYDNVGTMVCWHRNYDLGDKHNYADSEEFLLDLAREYEPNIEDKIDRLYDRFYKSPFNVA